MLGRDFLVFPAHLQVRFIAIRKKKGHTENTSSKDFKANEKTRLRLTKI